MQTLGLPIDHHKTFAQIAFSSPWQCVTRLSDTFPAIISWRTFCFCRLKSGQGSCRGFTSANQTRQQEQQEEVQRLPRGASTRVYRYLNTISSSYLNLMQVASNTMTSSSSSGYGRSAGSQWVATEARQICSHRLQTWSIR
jgi:hypothetical protein